MSGQILNVSKNAGFTTSQSNLYQLLSQWKSFPCFQTETHFACTHCFLSCHGTPPKESWLVFLYPPFRYWYTLMRSYRAFSCSPGCTVLTINLSSYEMLQSLNWLRGPLLDSLQYFPMDWAAQNWTYYSRRSLTGAEWMGRITSLSMLATLLMRYRTLLAFFATRVYWCLMFSLLSNRTSAFFSAKLLHSMCWRLHVWSCPRCRALYFPLNFMRFLSTHFSSWLRSIWRVAQPAGVSVTPLDLTSSANLLTLPSAPSSRLSMKMSNNVEPSIDPGYSTTTVFCTTG